MGSRQPLSTGDALPSAVLQAGRWAPLRVPPPPAASHVFAFLVAVVSFRRGPSHGRRGNTERTISLSSTLFFYHRRMLNRICCLSIHLTDIPGSAVRVTRNKTDSKCSDEQAGGLFGFNKRTRPKTILKIYNLSAAPVSSQPTRTKICCTLCQHPRRTECMLQSRTVESSHDLKNP